MCHDAAVVHLEPVGHDDDRRVRDGAEQLLGRPLLLLSVVLLLHLQGEERERRERGEREERERDRERDRERGERGERETEREEREERERGAVNLHVPHLSFPQRASVLNCRNCVTFAFHSFKCLNV